MIPLLLFFTLCPSLEEMRDVRDLQLEAQAEVRRCVAWAEEQWPGIDLDFPVIWEWVVNWEGSNINIAGSTTCEWSMNIETGETNYRKVRRINLSKAYLIGDPEEFIRVVIPHEVAILANCDHGNPLL